MYDHISYQITSNKNIAVLVGKESILQGQQLLNSKSHQPQPVVTKDGSWSPANLEGCHVDCYTTSSGARCYVLMAIAYFAVSWFLQDQGWVMRMIAPLQLESRWSRTFQDSIALVWAVTLWLHSKLFVVDVSSLQSFQTWDPPLIQACIWKHFSFSFFLLPCISMVLQLLMQPNFDLAASWW